MRKPFSYVSNCTFEVKHLIIVLRGLNIRTVQQKLWYIKEICFLLSDSDKRRNDVIWDAVEPFSRYELVSFAWQLLSAVFKYPPSLSARGFAELYTALPIIFYLFPTFIWVLSKRWSRGIAKQRGRRQRTEIKTNLDSTRAYVLNPAFTTIKSMLNGFIMEIMNIKLAN